MPYIPESLDSSMEYRSPSFDNSELNVKTKLYVKIYFVVVYSALSSETTKKVQTDETCLTNAGCPYRTF